MSLMLGTALLGGTVAAASAWREAQRLARARAAILDPCTALFEAAAVSTAPDGFPRLEGRFAGRRIRLALMPDTLAVKRLPQLWLSVGMATRYDGPALAIIVRPRGDDVFCTASDLLRRLDVPGWLPQDAMVRGGSGRAVSLLERLRPLLEAAFRDPCLKAVTLRPGAFRAIYRLAEGERGAHLLLRQARFDARVAPETAAALCRLLAATEAVATAGSPVSDADVAGAEAA